MLLALNAPSATEQAFREPLIALSAKALVATAVTSSFIS
jgi:hypothetical protein